MPRSESPAGDRSRDRYESRRDKDAVERRERRKERDYEDRDRSQRSAGERDRDRRSDHRRRHGDDRRGGETSEEEEERRRRRRRQKERERERDREERHARKRERHARHRRDRSVDDEKEAEQRAKAAETLLYATEMDDANPVENGAGSSAAGSAFKWAKKAEKERKMGMSPAEARRRDEDRRREAEEEISRLNRKREEREREQAIREEEEARMARLQESAAMAEWVAREDDFYLEQVRKRAVIRIRENRAKPIDLLAINLKWVTPLSVGEDVSKRHATDDSSHPTYAAAAVSSSEEEEEADLEIDMEEPYLLFDNLELKETEELHQDIQMYLSLEKNEQNLDFWRSMIVVCDDKLSDLRLADEQTANEAGIRSRIDPTVKAEMDRMLSTKTYEQLMELQDQVRAKLESGEPIDVEYWEGLLKALVVWRAKAKLRDMHEAILSNRIEYLRQRQRIEAERRARLGLPTIEEERLAKANEAARKRAEREAAQANAPDGSGSAADLFASEAAKALEEGEEVFATQDEDLSVLNERGQTYSWQDKYRPRKPRYFNKVHTGYEWNKYNRTHYDVDNPPPKQVQGYKFNIFYPDLIDKTTPPTFRIVKEKGNDETCLIMFEAGPPYETIGFRIVNKPWNMSHQRGFRAVFERGILQLHFNFQRMFYRK